MLKKGGYTFFILICLLTKAWSQPYIQNLKNADLFKSFEGPPITLKYGQVTAVKLVYDLKADQLYFINHNFYKFHYDFCENRLHYAYPLTHFNASNYAEEGDRDYLLANINYFKENVLYALELSPSDSMSLPHLNLLFKKVKEASFLDTQFKLLLNSPILLANKQSINKNIPVVTPSEVYGELSYQPIHKTKNCGTLLFVDNLELEAESLCPDNIIVLNKTPLFLPNVAGVIITEFQTPLSHLTILGVNRNIPVMAYKDALTDNDLVKLNNSKVCLTVKENEFKVKPTDNPKDYRKPNKQIRLKSNLEVDSIIDIDDLSKQAMSFVGNKASNFGRLCHLSKKHDFKTPEGAFCIPFYFYNNHLEENNLSPLVNNLLKYKDLWIKQDSIELKLKELRSAIKKAKIDRNLIEDVHYKIETISKYRRIRFRSSTNAEDAKGFSGAGLYTSKTGILNDSIKSPEKAIKKVWASLWSYEAFMEREYFGINHKDVYMGILAHRSFPNEAVNGVAITKNLYRDGYYGFIVNAQLGNENVVKPKPGVITDQFICYPDNAGPLYENTIDIITTSSLNNGQLTMSKKEIEHLANQLEILKSYFKKNSFSGKSYFDFGLDVEFKLDGESRTLYIKQARMYND